MSGYANDPALNTSGEERREVVYINGERVVVSYKTDGQKVEISSAYKEEISPQQEGGEQSSEQKEVETVRQRPEQSKIEVELTAGEKETLQKTLEEKVAQETKEKRDKIYDKEVSSEVLKNVSPSERPTLVLLAGQGGAGKSELAANQVERFAQDGGAIRLDPDALRKHNPDYHENIRADSRTAADKALVGDWTKEAFMEGVAGRYNIVLDGTAGNSKSVEDRIELARAAGYRVEMHAVAANGTDSWLGILKRHEEGKLSDKLHPNQEPEARYVPKHVHDESALGITETLVGVEKQGKVDYLAVYERGKYQEPIYENARAAQGGTTAGAEAFEKERNRARTPVEIERRQETIKKIDGLMEARGASDAERAEVRSLAYEGQDKGFTETARDVSHDKRADISAQEYIKNPEARKEVRAQAEERIKAYVGELRQNGVSEDRIAKIEGNLQKKLDNPAAAYGIKEGLELRELRKKADASTSVGDQYAFCDKREAVLADTRSVKQAFGADIKERTPQQAAYDKSRASWYRHGRAQMAKARKNCDLGHVKPEDRENTLKRVKKQLEDAQKRSLERASNRDEKQAEGQSQGNGGGGCAQSHSIRHCKCPIFPRTDLTL